MALQKRATQRDNPTTKQKVQSNINGIHSKKRSLDANDVASSGRLSKKVKATSETNPSSLKDATKSLRVKPRQEQDEDKAKGSKSKSILTEPPRQRLDVYVFGGGSQGELGLGQARGVKRPRLNPNLSSSSVGVVQIATGGMHCAALTHDNQIFTWGVNDLGALGRDTTWEGRLVDMQNENDADSDSDEGELNPLEATPRAVESSFFPPGTTFTQLVASDNATFALTTEGRVYGWGTFRSNEGVLSFSPDTLIQKRPALIPKLAKITKLAAGNDHLLALTSSGAVLSWGSGQMHQLGRRIVERTKLNALVPQEFGLRRNIVDIGAGSHHSFAVHKNGTVYSWGLNSFGQTGVPDGAGESHAATLHPAILSGLKGHGRVTCISGGNHHSIAVTDSGECLVWGRLDGYATGLKIGSLDPDAVIRDEKGNPRILKDPTRIPSLDVVYATAASDQSIAITKDGKAYSWGFSIDYQTGQGTTDDVESATLIDNTAVRGKKLLWAGAGGQYGILAGEPSDLPSGIH